MSKIIDAIFGKREKVLTSGSWGRCVQIGSMYHVESFGEFKGFADYRDAISFLQGV